MENIQAAEGTRTTTHPMVTVLFFFAIVFAVVFCGSYFSQQRSMARAVDAAAIDSAMSTERLSP